MFNKKTPLEAEGQDTLLESREPPRNIFFPCGQSRLSGFCWQWEGDEGRFHCSWEPVHAEDVIDPFLLPKNRSAGRKGEGSAQTPRPCAELDWRGGPNLAKY